MPLPIVLELLCDRPSRGFLTPFAGGELWSDVPVAVGAAPAARPALPALTPSPPTQVVYDGPGWVDGRRERVLCELCLDGARQLEFEDGERFRIAADGGRVVRTVAVTAGAAAVQRALGAPLALALGARGIFLLHASALVGAGGAIALAAPSGGGKSSLAAAAARHPELGLTRLADDILPVRFGSQPVVHPHFPQLKLPVDGNQRPGDPTERPWLALVEIEHRADAARVTLERLDRSAANRALARATVAARVFDPVLLGRHFHACADASSYLPVLRLRYPTGLDRLGEALAALSSLTRPGSGPGL